ncbi:MAG: transcriptional regulator [Candidatus Rokuibacteriota bacterium]|nr:MAG: transcriptional regulator [Candidatus Rokubacteria bacterium]
MAVPLLDLQAQYRAIEPEVMDALREVCARQQFILGPRVTELEERIAEYSGCRYGVGLSSGTDALLAALMALEIGPGDEVITTAFSFFATAGTIARLGARPLFADIDPTTYNLSSAGVAELIAGQCEMRAGGLVNRTTGGRVKALMPVHLFGQMAEMDAFMELARRHGLKVIEDAAQAIGSEYPGPRRAGGIGDIGCFSFFPSKNLGAFGDAGMCVTNDLALAERLKILRVHGSKPRYHHLIVGGNFRLDELQAAVLLVKLKHLDGWTARRQENARYYTAAFREAGVGDHVGTPRALDGHRHIFNQYVVRAVRRDDLKEHLREAGVSTEVYYPVPLHLQQCFAYLGCKPEDCPEALRATREALALPIYPELTRDQAHHVVRTVTEFYRDDD